MIALTGRAMRFLSREVRGLQATAFVLAACALLSSLLALARDRLLAHSFGASIELDVYYAAFRIPDLLFVATAALVSVYILIPELAKRTDARQRDYIDTVILSFSILATFLAGVCMFFAPVMLTFLFPAYSGHAQETLITLTRILLAQPVILGVSNVLAAVTQFKHRYAIYALSPLLYNIGIIVGIVFFLPMWGLAGVAYGVLLGALMHLLIQLPSAVADGFFVRIPRFAEPRALFETIRISVPRALALSVSQFAYLGLISIGAGIAAGSVAVFTFAYNLQAVPLAIIGASFSVAAFPTLALTLSKGERDAFLRLVLAAARYVCFWSIPASALILVLRAYIVRVILGSGAFDWTDTRLTAAVFALLCFSLVSQGLTLLLVRAYYAAGKTVVPVLVACFTGILTVGLAALSLGAFSNVGTLSFIEQFLRIEGIPGSTVVSLGFAFALSSIIGTILLIGLFERDFRGFVRGLMSAFVQSSCAAVVAAFAAYAALTGIGMYTNMDSSLTVFLTGLGGGVIGMIAAALTYRILGSKEFGETFTAMRSKLWREQPKEEVVLVSSAEE